MPVRRRAVSHDRDERGYPVTRVRGIWDQNKHKVPVKIDAGRDFGQTLTDFDYGLEYRRDFAPPLAPAQIGLDEWIGLHSTPTGSHRRGRLLRGRRVHQPHAPVVARRACDGRVRGDESRPLHVLVPRLRATVAIRRAGSRAPTLLRSADVVFVQFSEDCIRDATGVWLKAYVVQGIQYILSFAEPNVTKNVIINLSYGPTTGPHDGTAELETALTALVAEYDGSAGKPKLEIVLAAGNAYLSEGHVVYVRRHDHQPDRVEWTWRLPPDNSVLCFAEVWMKTVRCRAVSPST